MIFPSLISCITSAGVSTSLPVPFVFARVDDQYPTTWLGGVTVLGVLQEVPDLAGQSELFHVLNFDDVAGEVSSDLFHEVRESQSAHAIDLHACFSGQADTQQLFDGVFTPSSDQQSSLRRCGEGRVEIVKATTVRGCPLHVGLVGSRGVLFVHTCSDDEDRRSGKGTDPAGPGDRADGWVVSCLFDRPDGVLVSGEEGGGFGEDTAYEGDGFGGFEEFADGEYPDECHAAGAEVALGEAVDDFCDSEEVQEELSAFFDDEVCDIAFAKGLVCFS
ncbi:hypothetical protein ACIQTZ_21875 [Paenarthrobacter sp. NPDC090520]|uniref:hypothetical protein n=1 Tax=Paenarthrobacter sp. NPDC090520 TaxID=3364382 RepID=UPI0038171A8C